MNTQSGGKGPVFVIGCYRSGTSILAWCLGQHPNIVNLPETYWLSRMSVDMDHLFRLGTATGRYSHLGQLGFTLDDFYRHIGGAINNFILDTKDILIEKTEAGTTETSNFRRKRSEEDPKERWLDATPENTHYVYGLQKLFPDAKFIHILRDPDGVARSLMNFSGAGGTDYAAKDAYNNWLRLVRAAVTAERALGKERVIRVLFDDLVTHSEETMRRILGFLGEQYDVSCLLPLNEKINSSKVDDSGDQESSGTARRLLPGYIRKSRSFYEEILVWQQQPVDDESAYQDMKKQFEGYVVLTSK